MRSPVEMLVRWATPGDVAPTALPAALTPGAVARLLQLFTGLDDGVKFLVDLSADELRLVVTRRSARRTPPRLTEVGNELRTQLALLFDIGLLELRRITWTVSAALLEKLIEYEAVHTIDCGPI